jgi:hypothetical protein
MHNQISAIYLISLDDAYDLAERLDLPGATTIEPSQHTAFLCTGPNAALHFFIRFPDAERWSTHDPQLFLFLTAAPDSDEVRDWSLDHPGSGQVIEVTAFAFQSAADQHRFEVAL